VTMVMKFNLLQWHNYSNNMLNCHEKHKGYKTLVSICSSMVVTFRV
jgi:hypothetical protein